ncbi:cytokine receptor common subunit beta [Entelurus aequoreus]|uniref:cytokine receptor common subunit beta n=1 Tax=Entelurus aequoreus TaxID=161455 RepID=UPI002B1DE6D4|nr:cytokine receptor common subunit beta [Entelurus aequoreus]
MKHDDGGPAHACMLSNTSGGFYSCSVSTNTTDSSRPECLKDYDFFLISLCGKRSDGAETCEMLDGRYKAASNITPNAPCCLTARHNSSQYHFAWKHTYEKCFSTFKKHLTYQLRFYKRQDKHGIIHDINIDTLYSSVNDSLLVADTEYAAKVRSKPGAPPFFGDWSDWSSEVHWRTPSNQAGFLKVFITLGVMATLVLLLCCALFEKWRRGAFIPTPVLYCQGDFRNWADTQTNTTAMLKPEEMLHIDSLTSKEVHREERPSQNKRTTYENIGDPECDATPVGDKVRTTPSTNLSPFQDKTGFNSVPPTEGDSSWYCHEYCTLSTFQQHKLTARNCQMLP